MLYIRGVVNLVHLSIQYIHDVLINFIVTFTWLATENFRWPPFSASQRAAFPDVRFCHQKMPDFQKRL